MNNSGRCWPLSWATTSPTSTSGPRSARRSSSTPQPSAASRSTPRRWPPASPTSCSRLRSLRPPSGGADRIPLLPDVNLAEPDGGVEPPERPRRPPVGVARQPHHRRNQRRPDDEGVEQNGDGQAEGVL